MNPGNAKLRAPMALYVVVALHLVCACPVSAQVKKGAAVKAPAAKAAAVKAPAAKAAAVKVPATGLQVDFHIDFVAPEFIACKSNVAREGFDFSGVIPVAAAEEGVPVRTIDGHVPMRAEMLALGSSLRCVEIETGTHFATYRRTITRAARTVNVLLSVPTPVPGMDIPGQQPLFFIHIEPDLGGCLRLDSDGSQTTNPLGLGLMFGADDESVTPTLSVNAADLKRGFDRTFKLSNTGPDVLGCGARASGTLRLRYAGDR